MVGDNTAPMTGPWVLVVEDEWLIRDMAAEALAGHGFEVRTAANAKDALEYLMSGAPCDALFTDINLMDDMDGAALARLVRQLRPRLPVIYTSGSIAGREAFNAVADSGFVSKPYDPERVCGLLEERIAERRACLSSAHVFIGKPVPTFP